MQDFNFHIGGLEDAILALLKAEISDGVNHFALYSGELSDGDKLKQALSALAPRYPCILVAYADGIDVQDPVTSATANAVTRGKSLHFRHDCSFVVICISNDARGENARRRGVQTKLGTYQMLSRVREILSGLQFAVEIDDKKVLLNHKPLMPTAVEFIARQKSVTAYSQAFETYFRYSTLDRSAAGTNVETVELNLAAEPQNVAGENTPGVNQS